MFIFTFSHFLLLLSLIQVFKLFIRLQFVLFLTFIPLNFYFPDALIIFELILYPLYPLYPMPYFLPLVQHS